MRKIAMIFMLVAFFPTAAFASTNEDVKKGNMLYNSKKYEGAIKKYADALAKKSDSGIANFNMGGAWYKKAQYAKAVDSFNKAIASGDSKLVWAADYNIGNSLYRTGNAKEAKDFKGAKEQYESALRFYKRAIDLNPNDRDAKFNYEFAEKRLKELKEKREGKQEEKQEEKKEQQKQEEKKQDQQNKEEKKPQEGQGAPANQEQKPGQAGGEGRQEEEEKQSEQEQQAQAENEKEAKLEAYQSGQEEAGEMSEQEANMLLEGYKGEEATSRSIRLRRKPINITEPDKDW